MKKNYTQQFIALAKKRWVSNMDMAREVGSWKGATRLNESGLNVLKRWVQIDGGARFLQYRIVGKK